MSTRSRSDAAYAAGLDEVREAEQAWRRVWLRQLDAAASLLASRSTVGAALVDPRAVPPSDWVVEDLAWACRLGPFAVERRLRQAQLLLCHPRLRQAVEHGRTGPAQLDAVEEALRPVDPGLHRKVLDRALPADPEHSNWELSPGQLRRVLGQVVRRVDPAGVAARRRAAAEASLGVRVRKLADGLATMSLTGQAVSVRAIGELIRHLAHTSLPVDDDRSLPEQHIAVLLTALKQAAARCGLRLPGLGLELQLELPASTGELRPTGPRTPPEPSVIRCALTPEALDSLVDALDQLDLHQPPDPPEPTRIPTPPADLPTEMPDPVDADLPGEDHDPQRQEHPVPDEVLQQGASGSRPEVETPPATRARANGVTAEELDALLAQAAFDEDPAVDLDSPDDNAPSTATTDCVGDATSIDDDRLDLDELDDPECPLLFPPRPVSQRERPVGLLDGQPMSSLLLRELLDPAGLPLGVTHLRLRRIWRDTTSGQVVAVDQRAVPVRTLAEQLPPTLDRTARARALLALLTIDPPEPPPMTQRYRPTAAHQRLLRARDSSCTFPGCTRPAAGTDLDHVLPHPEGPTSVVNLHPLCRHHHRLKHDRAQVTRHPDGGSTWTSPSGQTRHSPPRHALVQTG